MYSCSQCSRTTKPPINFQRYGIYSIIFYLDEPSLSFLMNQCKKLFKASETLETWCGSPYASFLRMCTTHTLSELHRYWGLYAQTEQFSEKEKKRFDVTFTTGVKAKLAFKLKERKNFMATFRLDVPELGVVPDPAVHYWETGIMSFDPNEVARATFVNPTFAYSVREDPFPANFLINPSLSYHLAGMPIAPTYVVDTCKCHQGAISSVVYVVQENPRRQGKCTKNNHPIFRG